MHDLCRFDCRRVVQHYENFPVEQLNVARGNRDTQEEEKKMQRSFKVDSRLIRNFILSGIHAPMFQFTILHPPMLGR